MDKKIRIALLIGRGSRVPKILECVSRIHNARVVYVLSCVGEGIGTDAAIKAHIPSGILRFDKSFGRTKEERKENFSQVVMCMLLARRVDHVVMAGWMVIMSKRFVDGFHGEVVNIHPSILPAYPGKGEDVMRAQWRDKAVPAGCTLHYIDQGVDSGRPILHGYIVRKFDDYNRFRSFEEFRDAMHAKEDEVLCEGIRKIVKGWKL